MRPGVAALVFLAASLAAYQGARQGLLDDPGLGWHLRNIDAMLAHGGWLTEDPFSDRDPPGRWYTNQWLGEVPYWLGWKALGEEGVAAVNAVLIGLIGYALYRCCAADGAPWPVALTWALLGLAGTSVSWAARPNVYTILFTLLTARALTASGPRWWLVPLFAVWANVHGGFLAGFVLLGLAWLAAALTRGDVKGLSLLTAGCFVATLCNPYGWKLYAWTLALLGDPYFMNLNQEWKAVDFRSGGAMRYELLLLSLIALLAVSDRRPSLTELAFALAWLHLALTGFRYVALWVAVVTPLLSRLSLGVRLPGSWEIDTGPGSLFHTRPNFGHPLWLIPFAAVPLVLAAVTQGRHVRHGPEIVPTAAVDRFVDYALEWEDANGRRPRLYHAYDWGGRVTWKGWPRLKNWIDDRNEAQGRERCERTFAVMRAEGDWEAALAGVDLACIYPNSNLAARLRASGWVLVAEDRWAAVFARPGARLPAAPP